MKTRTEYQTEKKRLKVPKVEEFTISFTDGVSERLKVRMCPALSSALALDRNMLPAGNRTSVGSLFSSRKPSALDLQFESTTALQAEHFLHVG